MTEWGTISGNCERCDSHLPNCYDCNDTSTCTICTNSYYLYSNNTCVKDCLAASSNTYYDTGTDTNGRTCVKCINFDPNCRYCTNIDHCTECMNSKFLYTDYLCTTNCSSKSSNSTYENVTDHTCRLCNTAISNCSICHNATYCTKCANNSYLTTANNLCTDACPIIDSNTYANSSDYKCKHCYDTIT